MTSGYRNSAGTDTDNLFDPDVVGDGPSATGYKKSDGTLLKYAAAKYGTVGPNTGYRLSNGVDIATLWAVKGTAKYSLPIDGHTFTGAVTVTTGSKSSFISFGLVNGTTFQVTGASNSGTQVLASGSIPAGAVTVKYTFGAYTVPGGASDAGGSTTNGASSATAVSSNPGASYNTASWGSSTGTHERSYPFAIDFFNSSGVNISHTDITLIAAVEPST